MKINLFNIQHFSVHDGPGIRTVLFFKGCPLNCVWCHNPEGKRTKPELSFVQRKCSYCGKCAAVCPLGVHKLDDGKHIIEREKCIGCGKCVEQCVFGALELLGREYTVEEIMEHIARDDVFFGEEGGVTFSGGEPFLQFQGMYEVLEQCHRKGYSVCIETSGFTDRDKIVKASRFTDWFLYDCKETDAQKHLRYVGKDQKKIWDNLYALDNVGTRVMLRCPIIPGINDYEDHLKKVACLANEHPCVKLIELMPYHPLGISKAEQIGVICEYTEQNFLDKSVVEKYAQYIRRFTDVRVKSSCPAGEVPQ